MTIPRNEAIEPYQLQCATPRLSHEFNAFSYSPDGTQLATGSSDNTVRIWNSNSGALLQTLEGHSRSVASVRWSPDGAFLASGSGDRTIRIWDMNTGELFRILEDGVVSVDWSPSGDFLAAASPDNGIRIWDVKTGARIRDLEGQRHVASVAWSSDGLHVASGSGDWTTRIWNTKTGAVLHVLEGHSGTVESVAWSPDGIHLASGSHDGAVRVWNAIDGKLDFLLEGHSKSVESVAWSADGVHIASGGWDDSVCIWDGKTGDFVRRLESHASLMGSIAWSPDQIHLVARGHNNTARIWNTKTGELTRILEGHSQISDSAAWSPDGTTFAFGGQGNVVDLWNALTGMHIRSIEGHTDPVVSVDWSPDGTLLASGSKDLTIRVWDANTGTCIHTLVGYPDAGEGVKWSPDGTMIASRAGATVCIWNAKAGTRIRILELKTYAVTSLGWSPDGTYLAAGSYNGTIRVWKAFNGELIHTLEGHSHPLVIIAWSPDGNLLAAGGWDGNIRIWDTTSGTLVQSLEGHTNFVSSLEWSPDGTLLGSGGHDRTIRIWHCKDWAEIDVVAIPSGFSAMSSFAFRPAQKLTNRVGTTILGEDEFRIITWSPDSTNASAQPPQTIKVVSAKVVLMGESNVGKSTLALRLAEDRFEELGSTHGMRLWNLPASALDPGDQNPSDERREVVLWDLGGQTEYRLIHQLFLEDTTTALLLLDPTRGDGQFQEVDEWCQHLEHPSNPRETGRILVGTKADLGGTPDPTRIERTLQRNKMRRFISLSAKHTADPGVAELRRELSETIDWNLLSRTSRPQLFQSIRDRIEYWRDAGRSILPNSELVAEIAEIHPEKEDSQALRTVVQQLASQGVLADLEIHSGERILVLQIGLIEIYAGSLIQLAKEAAYHVGVPALELSRLLDRSSYPGIPDAERAERETERQILECVIDLFIQKGIGLKSGPLLIFPTLFPDGTPDPPLGRCENLTLYCEVRGAIDNIYSSLVSHLAAANRFGKAQVSRGRAFFEVADPGCCGIRRSDLGAGRTRIDLLFEARVPEDVRTTFEAFVVSHLQREGIEVREVLETQCANPECRAVIGESHIVPCIEKGKDQVFCSECGTATPIPRGLVRRSQGSSDLMRELREASERQLQQDARIAKQEAQPKAREARPIRILHLSDLHFSACMDPVVSFEPLALDLRDLGVMDSQETASLDYVVVTGDLTNNASREEFEVAEAFLKRLAERFKIPPTRFAIIPGNHDLDWKTKVYNFQPKRRVNVGSLKKEDYLEQENGILLRDHKSYPKRFDNFREFYARLTQRQYPDDSKNEFIPRLFEDHGLQFLELNSAWQCDEHFQERSSINLSALSQGIWNANQQIDEYHRKNPGLRDRSFLRVCLWHHPITGNEKIQDDAFVEQLRKANFRLCLHGHVHKEGADLVSPFQGNSMIVIGAGSFGAPMLQRPQSTPRLYHLLEIQPDHSKMRIKTRQLAREGGCWNPFFRHDPNNPQGGLPYLEITLQQ
ncbi:MAG: metallophosphoesterase [Fibrobacterota bacterium]|nr:MAG: metallophosphoesterase [Fibrobacterota bacterium]